jgi:predicted ATP-dependent serine protease
MYWRNLNMTEEAQQSLANYNGPDKVISSHEMKASLEMKKASMIHVNSRIPTLDSLTGGFQDGELITISGPTKNGKTLLAQTLTVNFASQNKPSLWFTYEVPARQFLSQFPEMPSIYLPQKLKAHALDWLEQRILESFEKYRTRIVFIDHLHYLVDMAKMGNVSIEIGTVVRFLKGLAVEHELIIFLLCHTTKGSAGSDLSYDSIRDSSFVSQESDTVFMVKRTPEEGDNYARVSVEFHRRTGVMEKIVKLVKYNGLLYERDMVNL